MKIAVAVRHLHFEGLGSLADVLTEKGFEFRYFDVGVDDFSELPNLQADLLIVLGAPVGVYEEDVYPFLTQERNLLASRLKESQPTLGICLGAQQIAAALGATVRPSGIKEIGFGPVQLTTDGDESPLHHLNGVSVLHWHGDTFAIPEGALHLAKTDRCEHQAFSLGKNVLALQFHPEIDDERAMEAWLVGHASELASAGVDPRSIRKDAARYIEPTRAACRKFFGEWLDEIQW